MRDTIAAVERCAAMSTGSKVTTAKSIAPAPAGTGKSVLALAAGRDAVLEQRTYNRVIVFRPISPVGGQDLGYLPGSEAEKMLPWGAAVAGLARTRSALGRPVDAAAALLAVPALHPLRTRALTTTLFARLLLQDAKVILLDEPFRAVDTKTVADLIALIERWHREGRTVLAALHDIEQVRERVMLYALKLLGRLLGKISS